MKQPPANRQGVQLVVLRQVAGADMGRGVGALVLEFVEFRGKRLGVSLNAGGGVSVVFQQGLGEADCGPLPGGCVAA